ncbi:MAG: CapA family protein [Bacteroidales bacterium]|nr:CapA family protein [Bacteroidales bacterium]
MKHIDFFFLFILFCRSGLPQDTLPLPDTNKLVMIFAGDIMGHDTQIVGAYDEAGKRYNYEPTFRYICDYISTADIAVGNLEVTLAGPPYKGYPQFSSPDELALEAKKAGFDVLINANNHALDRGITGFQRTLDILDSLQLLRAGTYRDTSEKEKYHPLIIEKNNIRIALLNYTYGTNGLKIDPPYIINRIDRKQIQVDLEKAKLAEADFTIVCMHWGKEYEREENAEQAELADFIFKMGADAIVGSHPHVIQPIRFLTFPDDSANTYPVVYSLGNFVSNQRAQYKDGGIIAELHFSKISNNIRLDSLLYLPYWVWREDHKEGKSTFYVLPVAKYETNPDSFNLTSGDIYRLNRFADDSRKHLSGCKESGYYQNRKGPDNTEVRP